MMAEWPSEEEKWAFWARLIHHYCGRYRPTPVMKDLKAIVGVRDYFIVTSNGEQHFELCGFEPRKIYEIEGQSQILCKLQMRHEQSRIIHCARQRIYPTAALCAV